eukprot:TRINITY_DN225_c0_g1_i1.p1 TRINITY_DN225_c0_g1~~TRINITY_DN225_c0_g1_i1.p1  ORF type:complete len:446 (-),score=195.29 TRINITY_DN225_c0_g1_i1:128-1465(-)
MAPSRNSKRAASSAPAGEPLPKKSAVDEMTKKAAPVLKKHGVTQASYKQIAEALMHPMASYLPEECRSMLLAGIPQSLCVPSDLRQELQNLAVNMMGEVICKIVENLQQALDAENTKVLSEENAKAELDEKLNVAESNLKDTQAAVSERDADLQASSEAVLTAKAALIKREEEQKAGDAELVATQASKAELDEAVTGVFQTLKAGAWEDAEQAKQHFQAMAPLAVKIAVDESLKTAMQSVLLKKPEQRGPFDATVIDELDKCFQAKIGELTQILDAGKPASEARAAAVAEAKAALEAAESKQKECSNNILAAKETQKEAAANVKAAKAAVADFEPSFKAATELRDEKQKELQTFVDIGQTAFNQMKDRLSAKKLKEIAAAEAAAKAEAEAAEAAKAAEEEAAAKAAEANKAAEEEAAAKAAEADKPAEPAEEPAAMETEAKPAEA